MKPGRDQRRRVLCRACAITLGVDLSDDQLLEGWNAIFAGEMPGIIRPAGARRQAPAALCLLQHQPAACRTFFSVAYAGVLGHFREIFLSSTIGLRKPDAAAYDHVVKAIGVPAERIVFFDDLAENIEGARARGLTAFTSPHLMTWPTRLPALGI